MAAFRSYGLGLAVLTAVWIWAQALPNRPPKPPKPPAPPDRIADVRRKLERIKPVDVTAQRALAYSRTFLKSAEQAEQSGRTFQADRLADAADSMIHVAEHQEHLRTGGGPKGPPPAESISDHLQQVYFRVQQADYFLKQSADSRAAAFPKWARDFYQLATRGYERKDWVAADENAKCAEEVVKCLEDLAQATTMTGPLPPPPPPAPKGPAH